MWEICSKLIIKATEQRDWRRSVDFIVTFEQTFRIVLESLLFTLNK